MPNAPATPLCPRCGYDQSGAVATWADHCPLDGTCPECGLTFHWRHVFHPDRDRVRGFFEHTKGFWPSLWAIPRTAWLVARPWTFWKRVQMHMTPRLGRAFIWLLLAALTLLTIKASIGSLIACLVHVAGPRPGNFSLRDMLVDAVGGPLVGPGSWYGSPWLLKFYPPEQWVVWPPLLLIAIPLWPLSFLLLPTTMRRCRLRAGHLWRGGIYAWTVLMILYIPWIFGGVLEAVSVVYWVSGSGPPQFIYELGSFIDDVESFEAYDFLFTLSLWLWLALWWLFAIRRGFKLPHAWGVWIALLVINALVLIIAQAAWEVARGLLKLPY